MHKNVMTKIIYHFFRLKFIHTNSYSNDVQLSFIGTLYFVNVNAHIFFTIKRNIKRVIIF